MPIKNIVFDIGNVLIGWDPPAIVARAFAGHRDDPASMITLLSGNEVWRSLNRGEMTLEECKLAYQRVHGLTADDAERLIAEVFAGMILIEETPPLMRRLHAGGYRLFALTDNVREVVAHLRLQHDFWDMFEGVTCSAEVGVLKPDPAIYRSLLDGHGLAPHETLFFDDMPHNVKGAEDLGMHARLFTHAAQAERDLVELGLIF